MQRIAIIGLGCAGFHGIKALRESGWNGEIHVYSNTEHAAANPMLTTYYVAGKIQREQMFPFGSLEELINQYNVILHLNQPVVRVDAEKHSVILNDGSEEQYDKILIATGARAIAPQMGQGEYGRSFLMRTVADADALKYMLQEKRIRKAVVIGASMVGIKIVELLYNQGADVCLVDMADRLFPLACIPETADILEQDLKEKGISLFLKNGVDHINECSNSVKTYLKDGQCLESDILVLCIGTRPNVELVANTEVVKEEPVLVKRGIVVNNHMETNISGIFAAGDCCEALNLQTGETMIIGLWANAAEQGRVAGCCMAGQKTEYKGSVPNNITHYFDQTFVGIGDPNLDGAHYIFRNNKGLITAICDKEVVKCVNILGNYRISGMIKENLLNMITGEGERLSLNDEGLLRASGVPDGFIKLLKAECI